jgi:hypothetical protein
MESAVSPVKPVVEVPSTDEAPERIQPGRRPSSIPTSPKAHELRARHESHRLADGELKQNKPEQVSE